MLSQFIKQQNFNSVRKKVVTSDDEQKLSDFESLQSYESHGSSDETQKDILKSDEFTPSIYKPDAYAKHRLQRQRSYRRAQSTVEEAKHLLALVMRVKQDFDSNDDVSGYSSSSSIKINSNLSKYKVVKKQTLRQIKSAIVQRPMVQEFTMPRSIPADDTERQKLIVKLKIYLSKYWTQDGERIKWNV